MIERAAACEKASARGLAASLAPCAEACGLGHSNSCARAGDARQARGERTAAAELHARACAGGSGLGCEAAGDHRRARLFYRVHCEQHHAASCAGLARLLADGVGGPTDRGAADLYARRACELGIRASCAP
jgi:TPR repeat protein